jgi:hypothetical protein
VDYGYIWQMVEYLTVDCPLGKEQDQVQGQMFDSQNYYIIVRGGSCEDSIIPML